MLNAKKIPLPIKIPSDYADKLGIHFTTLSKINSGQRSMPLDKACLFIVMAKKDSRLRGLSFYDLFPDLILAQPILFKAPLPKRLRS